jgi:hypothetical protein
MQKEVILHIGLHKTGSTSFQTFLENQLEQLRAQNTDVYPGLYLNGRHPELHLASMRSGVETGPRIRFPVDDIDQYRSDLRNRMREYFSQCKYDRIIFSTEHLSYLRTVEECQVLRNLFPENQVRFKIILVLRPKNEFLISYRKQMLKAGKSLSNDPKSAFYVKEDTWLTDFESLIDSYKKVFSDISILSYNGEGMLQLILDEIGLKFDAVDKLYYTNKTPKNLQIWKIRGKVNQLLKWICVKIGLRKKT